MPERANSGGDVAAVVGGTPEKEREHVCVRRGECVYVVSRRGWRFAASQVSDRACGRRERESVCVCVEREKRERRDEDEAKERVGCRRRNGDGWGELDAMPKVPATKKKNLGTATRHALKLKQPETDEELEYVHM